MRVRGWPRVSTAAALFALVVVWFFGRGIVIGTLANHERLTGHFDAHAFSWAAPDVTLKVPAAGRRASLTVVGQASHDQQWTIGCDGVEPMRVDIHAGLFQQLLPVPTACASRGIAIHSGWTMVPADQVGSNDRRSLSWQLLSVRFGVDTVPLTEVISNGAGLYGIEPLEISSDPEGILTERWDASWYRNIVLRGYRFNGDGRVQQNVAWPFLFPMLVKAVAVTGRVPVSSAMVGLNAALLLAALLLLFALGRAIGLTRGHALIAPVWLSFNPFAFFVVGGFSEPLFLMLELLIVLLLLRRKYWLAGAVVALLTATRFVGLIGVAWLAFSVWGDAAVSIRGRLLRVAFAGVAGGLGIVADMAIKGAQTGYPLAAFMVRKGWEVTPLRELAGMLHPGGVFDGEYLPILMLPFALVGWAAYVLIRGLRREGDARACLLIGAGVSVVAATLVLNPELHSAGRYCLPLVPAVVGLLGIASQRSRAMPVMLAMTAAGGAFMPLIVERIAMGLPPY